MPWSQSAGLVRVDWTHGHLRDAPPPNGERDEEVIGVAVTRPNPVEVDAPEAARRDRRIAALAVAKPRPGRGRGDLRQGRRPPAAMDGHVLCPRMDETISLHVVRFPAQHRSHDRKQIGRVHLSIPRHDRDHIGPRAQGMAIAGDDGRTHAVPLIATHHRRPSLDGAGLGAVAATIVHHDHLVDEVGHRADHAANEASFVSGRNHHVNASVVDHRSAVRYDGASMPSTAQSAPRPRRRLVVAGATGLGLLAMAGLYGWCIKFPPDTTPEGAYLRIASAVVQGEPESCFAYLEDEAQHACFTIANYATEARQTIVEAYPEGERVDALSAYSVVEDVEPGPPTWVALAEERGWLRRLRRDLSGIDQVETKGDRATITTTRGTRYPFRRRDNGIWGLTMFTAELLAEVEKLARDAELIEAAAADYRRGRDAKP